MAVQAIQLADILLHAFTYACGASGLTNFEQIPKQICPLHLSPSLCSTSLKANDMWSKTIGQEANPQVRADVNLTI